MATVNPGEKCLYPLLRAGSTLRKQIANIYTKRAGDCHCIARFNQFPPVEHIRKLLIGISSPPSNRIGNTYCVMKSSSFHLYICSDFLYNCNEQGNFHLLNTYRIEVVKCLYRQQFNVNADVFLAQKFSAGSTHTLAQNAGKQ